MQRPNWLSVTFLLAWLLLSDSLAISQERPTPQENDQTTAVLDELARKAEVILALVQEHHVDSPKPAAMWLSGARALQRPIMKPNPKLQAQSQPRELALPERPLDTPELRRSFLTQVVTREDLGRWQAKNGFHQDELLQTFINGMAPGGCELKSSLDVRRDDSIRANRYIGIGITIGHNDDTGYPFVGPLAGGPMDRAGGKQGDMIVEIDGQDAHNMTVMRAIELISGEEGTPITLMLRSPSDATSRKVVVTRGHIQLPSLAGVDGPVPGAHRLTQEPRIRYVKVTQIKGSTVHELKLLERQFRSDGGQAVIIDLRATHGNDLHHMLLLADALMDGRVIGRLRTKDRVQEFRADRERLFRDMPLAVLVDQHTSGSGEWLAAALQDNGAAVIVGDPTAGNAFVSTSIQVPGEDEFVQLATGVFERPSGRPLRTPAHRDWPPSAGLIPDRIIESQSQGSVVQTLPIQEHQAGEMIRELEVEGTVQLLQQFAPRSPRVRFDQPGAIDVAVRILATRLAALAEPAKRSAQVPAAAKERTSAGS